MFVKNINKAILFALTFFLITLLMLSGCSDNTNSNSRKEVYMNITPVQAKEIMDTDPSCVILDVRTKEEYDEGHIKNAVLIPDYEIKERAEAELKNKDQLILVYCRSGRRSKNAAQTLVSLGYTNIKEFGGIIDWPYETQN